MKREEIIAWAQERAIEYIDAGQLNAAYTSFCNDLTKFPETKDLAPSATRAGMQMILAGQLATPNAMKKWINSFE